MWQINQKQLKNKINKEKIKNKKKNWAIQTKYL